MTNQRTNLKKTKRTFKLTLTSEELGIVNLSLCAAYVDFMHRGMWIENFLPAKIQQKRAKSAKRIMTKVNKELEKKRSPQTGNEVATTYVVDLLELK